ncbi:hypothetical protein JCM14036_03300 [Desulfotomaculum defluvii]
MTKYDAKIIFAQPRLVWPVNDEPFFMLGLQQSLTGMAWEQYQVLVDEELKGVVFPEQSGVLTLLYPIKLDYSKPIVNIQVISDSGNELFSDDIELWDTTRSISIYNRDGLLLTRRVDPNRGKQAFYAIVDSESELPVSGQRMFNLNQEWRLYHFNGQEIVDIEAVLGHGFLWLDDGINNLRVLDESNTKQELPFNIRQVTMYPDRNVIPRLGEAITFIISVPGQSCKVTKILYHDKNIAFTKNGPRYITTHVMIKEVKPEFKIHILYKSLDTYYLEKRPRINWRGASLIKKNEEAILTSQQILEKEDLVNYPLQVNLPVNWRQKEDRQKLCLMEGYQILTDVKTTPQLLKSVGGLGAPLLMKKPYNSQDKLVIAAEIQNRGIVKDIYFDGQQKKTTIVFNCAYDAGKEHRILIWDPPGTLREIPGELIEQLKDGQSWFVPYVVSAETAIVVSYRGFRVGAWWGERFFQALLMSPKITSPATTAALLRWGKFPILSSQAHRFVVRLLKTYPMDVIAGWILDEGLPEGLRHGNSGEPEKAALRFYILDYRLGNKLNELMTNRYFKNTTEQHTAEDLVRYLSWCRAKINDISPLLYADLVRRNVRSVKTELGVIAASNLVQRLEMDILQLKNPSKINDERENLGLLAAREANVDYFFIKNGIVRRALDWIYQRPLGNWSRPNTLAACSFPFLRKYLCLSLINAAYN